MVSRRQFLRGNFKARQLRSARPGRWRKNSFIDACSRCGDCVRPCPTRIIVIVRGFPELDFKRGECTFCGACAAACKDGALPRHDAQASPWQIKAQVADCLPGAEWNAGFAATIANR
jgi:ferredoxin-type protein NapF